MALFALLGVLRGFPAAAYRRTPHRKPLCGLDQDKNCSFMNWTPIVFILDSRIETFYGIMPEALTMGYKIMFVDNAANLLEVLKWVFKDEPYDLLAFKNIAEALNKMKETEFPVVMVDQSMPEMYGVEFLKKVKEISPDTVGIIMTAYLDFDSAIDALDQGLVYRFINKPWDSKELKQAVKMAVAHYEIEVESRRQIAAG